MHQIATDFYTSSHFFLYFFCMKVVALYPAPILKVFFVVLVCTLWKAVKFQFNAGWYPCLKVQRKLHAYPESTAGHEKRVQNTHWDWDHRVLVGEDGCRGLAWGLVCPFFLTDLNLTAAGTALIKHHNGMCPLKWRSPGYRRLAQLQEARRLSYAPCWI